MDVCGVSCVNIGAGMHLNILDHAIWTTHGVIIHYIFAL